jgi:hypothetical protein
VAAFLIKWHRKNLTKGAKMTEEQPDMKVVKTKQPLYKKWWFWVIFLFLGIGTISAINNPVVTQQESEVIEIPCAKVQQDDPTLAKGETNILQSCVNGEKTIVYSVKTQNGKEISREQASESMTIQVVDEITAVGTKEEVLEQDSYLNSSSNSGSSSNTDNSPSGSSSQNNSPSSGVNYTVSGYCNDGTYVTGNPSARGGANACYGHKGWRDY